MAHKFSVKWVEDKNEYFKEYMRMYNANKYECSCGKMISPGRKNTHIQTKFHEKSLKIF